MTKPTPIHNATTLSQDLEAGVALLRAGRLSDAADRALQLLQTFPDNAKVLMFASEVARANGDLAGAITQVERAIALEPTANHVLAKAWMLSEARRRDEIRSLTLRAATLAGKDGALLLQAGKLLYHHNLHAEAIELYERARQQVGDQPGLLYDIAIARFYSGDFEQAERDLNRMLELDPQAGAAMYLRAKLRRQSEQNNHIGAIFQRLNAGFRNAEDEGAALYALAKELEDLGEHEKSFFAVRTGAKMIRSTFRYDINAVRAGLDDICERFDTNAATTSQEECDEAGAVFIVGMPRSGTTLAERMLVQSGKVKAAGELMDFGTLLTQAVQKVAAVKPGLSLTQAANEVDFAAIGREYMRGARQMAGGSERFIDKLPANYMYCGMIHKALPNAKIIHLSRNPLDSCYAMYKTLFFGAYEFSYDLDELADYYIAYRRVMRHWHETLPGAVLDVCYEDLVATPEVQARRMYAWCGLDWTPEALEIPAKNSVFATASSAQVREPIHSRSVDGARRHAKHLDGLAAKLKAAGVISTE